MSVNVNSFKVYCDFIANKVQAGGTTTTVQRNELSHQAQMSCFEKDRLVFIKTGELSDFLKCFLRSTVINPNVLTGFHSYPADFQHTAGVRSYYNKKERPVELVENKAWGEVQVSLLAPPTKQFPKYTEFANEYRFLPRDIGIVMLDYLKEPVKPIWAYTISSNVQVYDPTASVDFEWDAFSLNRVAAEYLSYIGINIQSVQLAQYSQQFKEETKSIV